MQNNKNYSEILDLITTKEDVMALAADLDLLEGSIYELKNGNFEETLTKIKIGPATLIRKLIVSEDKKVVLNALREELKKIKFLELSLSEEPNQKTVDSILLWLKNKVQQKLALDIKIDHELMGGATISFDGKFFDGSVSHKLEEVLKNYGQ